MQAFSYILSNSFNDKSFLCSKCTQYSSSVRLAAEAFMSSIDLTFRLVEILEFSFSARSDPFAIIDWSSDSLSTSCL